MNNVTNMNIKPNTKSHTYRKHRISITFVPDKLEWRWECRHTYEIQLDGLAKSHDRALSEAKKKIDHLVDGR